jgi:hypothetical protein
VCLALLPLIGPTLYLCIEVVLHTVQVLLHVQALVAVQHPLAHAHNPVPTLQAST